MNELATEGTRVTCEDIATGETESKVIKDDYMVITDGRMEIAAMQFYGNGTVQITLKRKASVSRG
ncbi:MAG TPA: hypothetical protein VH063_18825 [Gaiellaceae bacterium]|jgi:hypothetical protein|nr:hypothetical protein [Gaiellaceae bacterium]